MDEEHDDFLLMPSIESMRISTTKNVPKGSKKNSGNNLKIKKSDINDETAECSSSASKNPLKKRVLHTYTQPDGCIVGYVEEVDFKKNSLKLSNEKSLENFDNNNK